MIDILLARFHQGHRTMEYPDGAPAGPGRSGSAAPDH
jgi:hypothetical protein